MRTTLKEQLLERLLRAVDATVKGGKCLECGGPVTQSSPQALVHEGWCPAPKRSLAVEAILQDYSVGRQKLRPRT